MSLSDLLSTTYFDNTIQAYVFFGLILFLGLLFKRLISGYLGGILYRLLGNSAHEIGRSAFDDRLKKPLNNLILLGALYLAAQQLQFPANWGLATAEEFGLRMFINKSFALLYAYFIFWLLLRFVDFVGEIMVLRASKTDNKMDDQIVPFAVEIAKVLVVILGGLTILSSVFNVNVAALATGLGIGGIAIAMASKESLENLLGSFTIFLDKPFTYGDIVTVNGYTGVVEKVGFRSTRIRTFDKSIVTVPNKNMVNAELDNLGMRPIRRVKFNIGLVYGTKVDQMKAIVNDLESMINAHPNTTADGARVRFEAFGSSSLDLMVLYYVDSPDWELLINTRQDINYRIIEIVHQHKSDFAFPTTSVHIEK